MIRTPKNVAAVEPVDAEPRAVIPVGRKDEDINRRRRSVVNGAWRRRVIVSRRGSAVTVNHFGAGVRARSRCQTACQDRQPNRTSFLPHDRCLSVVHELNQPITAKLQNTRATSPARSQIFVGNARSGHRNDSGLHKLSGYLECVNFSPSICVVCFCFSLDAVRTWLSMRSGNGRTFRSQVSRTGRSATLKTSIGSSGLIQPTKACCSCSLMKRLFCFD